MDHQIENLIRAIQEEEVKAGNDLCCPPYASVEPRIVNLEISDKSNVLHEIYHTSSFLQKQDPGNEGSMGFNITRHSVLMIIQNPYMCAMCGAIFAFSGNLTKHIRITHSPAHAVPRDAKGTSTIEVDKDRKVGAPRRRGRPQKTRGEKSDEGNKENEDEVEAKGEESTEVTESTSGRPRREVKVPKRYLDDGNDESCGFTDDDEAVDKRDEDVPEERKTADVRDTSIREDTIVKPSVRKKRKTKSPPVNSEIFGVTIDGVHSVPELCKPYLCEFCEETFRNSKQRSQHRVNAHRNEIFKCKVCEKEFALSKFWLYQRHCQTHESSKKDKCRRRPEAELICNICGTSVATASCLSIHKQNLHPEAVNIDKPFRCIECGKAFRTKYLLKSHTGLVHTDEKPFSCSVCDTRFKTKQYLEMHFRVHTGEKPFQCRFCSKCFRTNAGRRKHERTHTKERPYKCRYCDKDYYTKISMLEHTTSAHTQDRPLMCEICGKTFVHRASLRQHKFLHTGKKPFICEYCNRAFSQKVNLQDHVRSLHTHEKPYKCNMCEMSFSRSTGRNEHMRKKHKSEADIRQYTLANFHTYPVEEVEISGLEIEF